MNDTTQGRAISVIRWILIVLGLLVFGNIVYFGGRILYSLGQRAAEQVAGVDETLTSQPPNTDTPIPVTPSVTPTFGPTVTSTFIVQIPPTATETKIPWTSCPGIVVTVNDTEQGDFLHVLRCEDGYEYDIGPLTKGAFAVSPDDKFIVYASINGLLYGSKIGDPVLYTIKNLKKEGPFTVFPKKIVPKFELNFVGDAPPFVLEVYESKYGQNFPVRIPGWLSQ
jgi:hypothetical protein